VGEWEKSDKRERDRDSERERFRERERERERERFRERKWKMTEERDKRLPGPRANAISRGLAPTMMPLQAKTPCVTKLRKSRRLYRMMVTSEWTR
jgi:hypothetical protein